MSAVNVLIPFYFAERLDGGAWAQAIAEGARLEDADVASEAGAGN